MGRPTLRRRLALALLGLAAATGLCALFVFVWPQDSGIEDKDFTQEYLLARAILEHANPYLPIRDLAARYVDTGGFFAKLHPTPHPPTVGLLALPLGLLSYPTAARAWFGIELGCLFGAVLLLARTFNVHAVRPLRERATLLVAVALVAWPPVSLELGLGQLMLPVLLGLTGSRLAFERARPALAGSLLGCTLLIKPVAVPWLVVLAWRREWRALAATAAVVVLGGVLSVLAIGLPAVVDYVFTVLPMMSAEFLSEPTNISLLTLAPRLGSAGLAWLLPVAFFGLTAWWACRRLGLADALCLMTLTGLLVSPISWYFYVLLALLPIARLGEVVWERGLRPAEVSLLVAALCLLSVAQVPLFQLARSGVGSAALLEPDLGLALLAILIVRLSPRPAAVRTPASNPAVAGPADPPSGPIRHTRPRGGCTR